MEVGLIILAGGRSSRMGKNKALLPLANGKTVIENIIGNLSLTFSPNIIVTNDPASYQWLNAIVVEDIYPGMGPLAGIHAGLLASVHDYNLVVACDMPFSSLVVGEYLKAEAAAEDAVVPCYKGRLHPLFAIYRKSCLPKIEESLQANQRRVAYLLQQLHVRYVENWDWLENGEDYFLNMNRPEEYEQVMQKKQKT